LYYTTTINNITTEINPICNHNIQNIAVTITNLTTLLIGEKHETLRAINRCNHILHAFTKNYTDAKKDFNLRSFHF
jgi:hypothetical protein